MEVQLQLNVVLVIKSLLQFGSDVTLVHSGRYEFNFSHADSKIWSDNIQSSNIIRQGIAVSCEWEIQNLTTVNVSMTVSLRNQAEFEGVVQNWQCSLSQLCIIILCVVL